MESPGHVAVIGAGLIGASWTALFLASGRSVAVHDPSPDAERALRECIETAWPVMERLGLTERGDPDAFAMHASAAAAVEGAGFVQESVPERPAIKRATFAEIEPALERGAIVASSASGLTLAQMQEGWGNPGRLILGHPFNPPHLIPLVELMANERTDPDVLPEAEAFYESVGKVTIRIKKGLPGHVANRLQAAVWREAIHMVVEGVASVGDVDKAMWAGPGLRWAAMGPTMLFHLGASGGMRGFCDHFAETFNGWWEGLGDVRLTDEVIEQIVQGVEEEAAGKSQAELAAERDRLIVSLRHAMRDLRDPPSEG